MLDEEEEEETSAHDICTEGGRDHSPGERDKFEGGAGCAGEQEERVASLEGEAEGGGGGAEGRGGGGGGGSEGGGETLLGQLCADGEKGRGGDRDRDRDRDRDKGIGTPPKGGGGGGGGFIHGYTYFPWKNLIPTNLFSQFARMWEGAVEGGLGGGGVGAGGGNNAEFVQDPQFVTLSSAGNGTRGQVEAGGRGRGERDGGGDGSGGGGGGGYGLI